MKHLFIINPAAGIKDRSRQYIEEIEHIFADLDEHYEIALTEYPRHATEIARAHARRGTPLRIYSIGGDGTLGEVLAGCYDCKNVELAAYPSGTGNDFIKVFPGRSWDSSQISCDELPRDLLPPQHHLPEYHKRQWSLASFLHVSYSYESGE